MAHQIKPELWNAVGRTSSMPHTTFTLPQLDYQSHFWKWAMALCWTYTIYPFIYSSFGDKCIYAPKFHHFNHQTSLPLPETEESFHMCNTYVNNSWSQVFNIMHNTTMVVILVLICNNTRLMKIIFIMCLLPYSFPP